MNRLTRMVLWDTLKIFCVSLIALTAVILLIAVVKTAMDQGLGPLAVLQLLPFVLPLSLQFAIPATALFSVCCVFGRMSADGEIAAVKASGISPVRLLMPAWIFALALSPLTVALGDLAGSWGVPGMKRVLMMSIEEVVVRVLASERSYSTPQGLSIHVRDVTEDRRLIHPSITLRRDAESQPLRLTAREGRIQLNPQTQQLDIIVDDFHIEGGSFRMNHPKRGKIPINLDKVFRKGGGQLRPSELPLLSLRFQRQQTQTQLASMRGHQATHAAFSLASARWDKLSNEEGQRLRSEIKSAEHRIGRLDLEPWRRWATGFSCLCFCFVGAPLAVLLRSRDYWMTFGACFLPILLIYYPLMMLGTDQAKQGEMPLYAPWLGNITLLAIGVFLVTRVRRY